MFIGPEKGYVNHNCLARDPYSLPLLLEAYPPIHVAMTTTSLTECFTNNIKSYLASVSMPATGLNRMTIQSELSTLIHKSYINYKKRIVLKLL
jgi:hypothetical protein